MLRKLKVTLGSLALAVLGYAQNPQSPIYPTRAATDNDLYVASNKAGTNLTAPISTVDSVLNVTTTTLFTMPTIVLIDSELIAVCSKTSNSFTICSGGRGYDHTNASTHNNTAPVSGAIASRFFNQASAEIKAIELQGSWHLDPGIWLDQQYFPQLNSALGVAVSPDTDRLNITNIVGHRPEAVQGDIHPPADPSSTTYEAAAISGIAINKSSSTNAVSGSFFAALGANGPSGFVATAGTTVTELSGPVFQSNWANSNITINGVEYTIATVTPPDTLTLTSSAGTQAAVAWYKRIYVWGINTLLSDGLPGASGAPHYKHAYLTNEWDVNVFDTSSKVIMHSIGGNGNAQPAIAYGYLVNTLSASSPGTLKWTCGFCLLDAVANSALQIGVTGTGNNLGSMPILMYSRDSSGNVNGGAFATDQSGNFLFHPGFAPAFGNPGTVFLDTNGNVVVGITGFAGGAKGLVQAGGTTRIQTGTDALANLGAESGGTQVFCSDCDTPPTEGDVCTAAGNHSGAVAFRIRGAWHCF